MTDHYNVVVIGGGIVGCSVLYGLAKLGCTDSLLIEKRELTSGSTWHAAGNVTYFGHYPGITRLYVDSIKTYLEAEKISHHCVGFHAAGSLRLASTRTELDAYKRLEPMYQDLNVEYRILNTDEINKAHPLLDVRGLHGAAYTPGDGHVDATGATHALAKAARTMGAEIMRQSPVEQISKRNDGNWSVTTNNVEVIAEHVVLANSFWAREMAQPLGLNLPLYALEHHEVVTDEVEALMALDFEVPTVRDPYAPSNTRQEGNGFLCGVYESEPVPWAVDGIPPDFAEQLLVPDFERLEAHLTRVMERIPAFGDAGIKVINNGPICYTPDGCPLLGPVDGHPGLWLASGFSIGIGTGGGSGEFLANWIVSGRAPYDLPGVYPSRYSNDLTKHECIDMIRQTYAKGYTTPVI